MLAEIRRLVVQMAEENPTWGCTRIRGRAEEPRASGRTIDDRPEPEGAGNSAGAPAADVVADLRAGALGRDRGRGFFTTEVWTWRSLVTYYTVFVIDLASRRVRLVGSTPHPDELFARQMVAHSPPQMTASSLTIAC